MCVLCWAGCDRFWGSLMLLCVMQSMRLFLAIWSAFRDGLSKTALIFLFYFTLAFQDRKVVAYSGLGIVKRSKHFTLAVSLLKRFISIYRQSLGRYRIGWTRIKYFWDKCFQVYYKQWSGSCLTTPLNFFRFGVNEFR